MTKVTSYRLRPGR